MRLPGAEGEAGFTLIELLVATAMSILVVGAATSMLITAVKDQPDLSKQSQNISSARWVLERLTREIRNGEKVDKATASEVSFQTYVRHATCGGTTPLESTLPSIKCEVTYKCTTTSCSRIEAGPESYTGAETTIYSGIDDANVFSYVPSAAAATYVGITLHIPNPSGPNDLTVSDGASLRNATLAN